MNEENIVGVSFFKLDMNNLKDKSFSIKHCAAENR